MSITFLEADMIFNRDGDAFLSIIDEMKNEKYLSFFLNQYIIDENFSSVEKLLSYGADANLSFEGFKPPIITSSEVCNSRILKILGGYGANVNIQHSNISPLIRATEVYLDNWDEKDALVFQYIKDLVSMGASPIEPNMEGITPLFIAQRDRAEDLVDLFLSN